MLASMQHDHIVAFREVFVSEDEQLCLVMDYVPQGDLYRKILEKRQAKSYFTEEYVWRCFICIV